MRVFPARIVPAFSAVALYVLAWRWTFLATDKLFEAHTPPSPFPGVDPGITVCSPTPPKEIRAFLVIVFVVFSSFALWYFWAWLSELMKTPYSGEAIENGYIVLSAIAKTVLHSLLAVSSLGLAFTEAETELTRKRVSNMYDSGFGIAGGVFGGVVVLFAIVWIVFTYCITDASETNKMPVYFGGIAIRWYDYAVSASIMWAALSVSWGLSSYDQMVVGAILHAVAMVLASQGERPGLSDEPIKNYKRWLAMHTTAGIVHITSAVTIGIVATRQGTIDVRIPFTKSGDPSRWYFKLPSMYTDCDELGYGRIVKNTDDESGRAFPIAAFAITFAAWSGLCHIVTVVASVYQARKKPEKTGGYYVKLKQSGL
jgi:hypothetical protein